VGRPNKDPRCAGRGLGLVDGGDRYKDVSATGSTVGHVYKPTAAGSTGGDAYKAMPSAGSIR
jgi:hypothetical protein